MMIDGKMLLASFVGEVLFVVILSVVVIVGIAWSHCPRGIIRTLIEQRRTEKQHRNT